MTSLTRGGKQEGREKGGGGGEREREREKELRYLVDENSDLNCLYTWMTYHTIVLFGACAYSRKTVLRIN